LRAGRADIGLIPAAAYASQHDLVIIPDIAIAARGQVRSILLVSKVPREQIRTLAADTSSRSSVALLRVLFRRWFGREPGMVPAQPELGAMLARCDAALLIGDRALQADRSHYQTWDLAEEWFLLTGKPFVFAFWAIRGGALRELRPKLDLASVFRESRDHGLMPESIAVIAREWSARVGVSKAAISEYLTGNIKYALNDDNLAGLQLFLRQAAEDGVLQPAPPLRFLG
jgi:chorismate dehydratase